MKTKLLIILMVLSAPALALRCSNNIVDVGDSMFKVLKLCKGGSEQRILNSITDEVRYYYSDAGMNYEMIFIDGNLDSIEGDRQ